VNIDKNDYFRRAESWGFSTQKAADRAQRTAWIVAGVMAGIAAFEAVALAMLLPLKTVQPVTLLVDRHTGYVQALDPTEQKRITANDALTQSFLAQYVTAREGFDRATVSSSYRRVALWSAGTARASYLAEMPASNPSSPLQRFVAGAVGVVQVKSISKVGKGAALVRFDTQRLDRNGAATAPQPWISLIRYRYTDAPMTLEDRLVNPMGFQVLSYRRDAEAPPPAPQVEAIVSPAAAATRPQPPAAGQPASSAGAPRRRTPAARSLAAKQPSATGFVDGRAVPISQLPLGSPLSPAAARPNVQPAEL
jgi:type IV secretion system protein VirB8